MGYEIQISCALNQTSNVKQNIINKALLCKCEYYYDQYEMQGRRKQIYRMHYIMTFIFPEDGLPMQAFIRYIKAAPCIYLECISTDTGKFEILYASAKYLSLMDKQKAAEYKAKLKSRV